MLSNLLKHAKVGILCGFIVAITQYLVNLIPNTHLYIGWFSVFCFALGCGFWEYWQYEQYGAKPYYWSIRGLHTICDFVSGVGSFTLILFLFGAL